MKRLAVLSLLLLAAAAGPIGSPAFAQGRQSWDGAWAGGWSGETGAQFIFAGDDVIGVYWRDDYVDDAKVSVSPDGATATITWPLGEAVLTRTGPASARVTVREPGRPAASFAVKKD
jgi:hypothetical protein